MLFKSIAKKYKKIKLTVIYSFNRPIHTKRRKGAEDCGGRGERGIARDFFLARENYFLLVMGEGSRGMDFSVYITVNFILFLLLNRCSGGALSTG